jgi:hypothetical protein
VDDGNEEDVARCFDRPEGHVLRTGEIVANQPVSIRGSPAPAAARVFDAKLLRLRL